MLDAAPFPPELPERIASRLGAMKVEINTILQDANRLLTTRLPEKIAFEIRSAVVNRDILSDYERAQSVSFITRYEHFPADLGVHLGKDEKDNWYIRNLWDLRQALNDFRPVIFNQSDSVFYQNIHNTWFKMLREKDHSKGTLIRVLATSETDATDTYALWLGERNKALRHIISSLDYGYLYNGYLQHSDTELSKRLFDDYTSGELNWLLWKHVLPLGHINSLLLPYHQMMRVLTFPRLGPL
ncbi:MAG: hypothetical protein ABL995_09125 [Bryobacteraceae bacterium]